MKASSISAPEPSYKPILPETTGSSSMLLHRPTPPPVELPHRQIPAARTTEDLPDLNELKLAKGTEPPLLPRALTETDNFISLDPKFTTTQDSLQSAESLDSNAEETLSIPRELPISDIMKQRQKEWAERGAAKIVKDVTNPVTGQVTKQVIKKGINDFKFGETLGDGSYSTVLLATSIDSQKQYAVKILNKEYLIKQKKVKYVNIEKNTLQRLNNTKGIISLYFTFQDESSLYFLLEYAPNGDLLSLMRRFGSINEKSTRYYSAQIIDALSFMHDKGVIHRDLKPENILLDKNMKVKLTDFGTARLLDPNPEDGHKYDLLTRSNSFVGTAEYVSPELLNDSYSDFRCDIWAFGCILFQMIAGKPPFKANNEYLTFQKVMKVQYAFTAGFPLVIRDLVKNILIKNPEKRLLIDQIKAHAFYKELNFSDGSVWDKDPPELGPYKVSARALQPALPKASSSPAILPTSPPLTTNGSSPKLLPKNFTSNESRTSSETSSQSKSRDVDRRTQRILDNVKKEISQRNQKRAALKPSQQYQNPNNPVDTTLNPAAAAAAALYSNKNNSTSRKPSNSSAGSGRVVRKSSTTINTSKLQTNGSKSSLSSPLTIETHIDVPPMGKIDIFWSYYLKNIQERIVRMGEVKVAVIKNQTLESRISKSKATLLDADGRNPKKSTLLTQVARGGGTVTGFRQDSSNLSELDYYQEFLIEQDNLEKSFRGGVVEEHPGESIAKLKNFFSKNNETNSEFISSSDYTRRMCVITTFGRCLLFARRNKLNPQSELFYDLEYEIDISQHGLQIKEIVFEEKDSTGDLFVIQTPYRSFIFQPEENEIPMWLKSLTLAIRKKNERHLSKEHTINPIANKAALLADHEAQLELKDTSSKSNKTISPRRSSFTSQRQKQGQHLKNVIRPTSTGSRMLARSEQFLRNK